MIPSYLYLCSFPTGSNYICNPPVTDTDIDTMYLVSDLNIVWSELEKMGWKRSGISEYPVDSDDWFSCRNGIYNALITNNQEYFNDFFKATEEAKRLNLTNKEDRIALFTKMCKREPKQKNKFKIKIEDVKEWIREPTIDTGTTRLNRIRLDPDLVHLFRTQLTDTRTNF